MNIDDVISKVRKNRIIWRGHATQRLIQRRLKRSDILASILSGEIIEIYQEGKPFPSCLILGFDNNNIPIHVVCAIGEDYLWIITAYQPDLEKWNGDFKTRKG